MEEENAMIASWLLLSCNFSAISHNKGIVDGIGGMVMSAVWCYVRRGEGSATITVAFLDLTVLRNPGVNVKFFSQ